MLKAAKRAAVETAARLNRPAPIIVAVTALTSLDDTCAARNRRQPIDGAPGRGTCGARVALGARRGRRVAARAQGAARRAFRRSPSSLPASAPRLRRRTINRARSAPARRSPPARVISSWAAPSSPRRIRAAPPRTSRDRAPDDLQQARLPSVRRDESARPSRHCRNAERPYDCARGDRHLERSRAARSLRPRNSRPAD